MKKLATALMLTLLSAAAMAQNAGTGVSDTESVSPYVTYGFLIIFFGMIVGVGWYMWKGDKNAKSQAGDKRG